jgi:hypothetical protein
MRRHHPFDPVTTDSIRSQFRENFSQGILTLISIVLGVSLGILTQSIHDMPNPWQVGILIRAFTTFLIISGTYYFYNYFVSVFTLPPSFFQVMLPFTLGMSIIAVNYAINDQKSFWIAVSVFCFTGAISFLNTMVANHKSLYDHTAIEAFQLIRSEQKKNMLCFLLMSLVTGLFIWKTPAPLSGYVDHILFAWNGSIYFLCVILTEHKFLRGIYKLVKHGPAGRRSHPTIHS